MSFLHSLLLFGYHEVYVPFATAQDEGGAAGSQSNGDQKNRINTWHTSTLHQEMSLKLPIDIKLPRQVISSAPTPRN